MKTWLICSLMPLAAFAETAPAATGGPASPLGPMIPLVLIFGIFYLLVLRPQQKKAKQHQAFLAELKRGDMVITASGIIGTIRTVSDKIVTIEVDNGVCLKVVRSQIAENARNLSEEKTKSAQAQLQEEK